jgi:hypothetical protein
MDLSWNLIPLVLWVKIENSTIPIAATATVLKIFIKVLFGKTKQGTYGYSTGQQRRYAANAVELTSQSRNQRDDVEIGGAQTLKSKTYIEADEQSQHSSQMELVHDTITIK